MISPILTDPAELKDTRGKGRNREWERRWKVRLWALPSVISNREVQAVSVGRALLHTLDLGPWLGLLQFVFSSVA